MNPGYYSDVQQPKLQASGGPSSSTASDDGDHQRGQCVIACIMECRTNLASKSTLDSRTDGIKRSGKDSLEWWEDPR